MTSTTSLERGAVLLEQLPAVTAAWYRLQVQHAHLLQHLAVTYDLNPIDLRLLKFLGVDHEPKTPKELGRFLEIRTGTATAMIDRLEARRFIRRQPNPNDRRSTFVHLDERGLEVVDALRRIYQDALASIVTADNRDGIISALQELEKHLTSASEADHISDATIGCQR